MTRDVAQIAREELLFHRQTRHEGGDDVVVADAADGFQTWGTITAKTGGAPYVLDLDDVLGHDALGAWHGEERQHADPPWHRGRCGVVVIRGHPDPPLVYFEFSDRKVSVDGTGEAGYLEDKTENGDHTTRTVNAGKVSWDHNGVDVRVPAKDTDTVEAAIAANTFQIQRKTAYLDAWNHLIECNNNALALLRLIFDGTWLTGTVNGNDLEVGHTARGRRTRRSA